MLERLKSWLTGRRRSSREDMADVFKAKYERFKELLDSNAQLSHIIADIEDKLQGRKIFGMSYVRSQSALSAFHTMRMVQSLNALSGQKYHALFDVLERINAQIKEHIQTQKETALTDWVLPYERINKEMVDYVGGKNANLGEVRNGVGLPIPEGYAITTEAFHYVMRANDLVDEINRIKMRLDPNEPESVTEVSESIQGLILLAVIPPDLEHSILEAHQSMLERIRNKVSGDVGPRVALRSSAIGEDSELSYAGQYLSVLNVTEEMLIRTYKYILASLYTPRAISYRLNKGIRDEDIAMSVACLEMVESVASGVVYSRHPYNILDNNVLISAVWGLGPYAVDGVITPDTYRVSKEGSLQILEKSISDKPVKLVSNPAGGLSEVPNPPELRASPCLPDSKIRELARYALDLENHYGCPQDMEWALDPSDNLIVLQTRPLNLGTPSLSSTKALEEKLTGYEILLDGGASACPGVGFGPAYHVRSDEDLNNFPEGGVLIARRSSPKFVVVMKKAQAIVTDAGSVTGHMASLSREFGIPTLLDTKRATEVIPQGAEITVDAISGRVFQGRVEELMGLGRQRESHMMGTPVYETLKKVSASIIPLHLVDPKSPDFTPESCKSMHDIMRLVHEFSYSEMFQISDLVSEEEGCAVKLVAPIPLDLYVIDLGNGIRPSEEPRSKIEVEDIVCIPFRALLTGLLHEDLRVQQPRPIQLKGFLSVMSEQMFTCNYSAERFGDRSYAILSDKYLNFSSRVGYHYSIVDSYCGKTVNKNYITFSFKGGAADFVRRNRRVRCIGMILQELGFHVEVDGDRVTARVQKYEQPVMEEKLDRIGRLLIFTRQMDMLMNTEASVSIIAEAFLKEDYHYETSVCEPPILDSEKRETSGKN